MILTLPVLAYQLFFVALLYVASRFSRTALNVAAIACLLWTCTHVFFLPLAVLQGAVIVASYMAFRRPRKSAIEKRT